MSQELRNQIYKNFSEKETKELLEIWQKNDRVEWTDLAFEVLEEVLRKRVKNIPSQNKPIFQYQESENEALEDWEIKLLDNKNQPELYDVLEVLNLKDNINKVAIAVIVVYTILAITNLKFIQEMLNGYYPTLDELPEILSNLFLTILLASLRIATAYFPLKALAHVLRILMEIEFNSRSAK